MRLKKKKKSLGIEPILTKLPFLETASLHASVVEQRMACVGFVSVTGFIGSNIRNGYFTLGFVFYFWFFGLFSLVCRGFTVTVGLWGPQPSSGPSWVDSLTFFSACFGRMLWDNHKNMLHLFQNQKKKKINKKRISLWKLTLVSWKTGDVTRGFWAGNNQSHAKRPVGKKRSSRKL